MTLRQTNTESIGLLLKKYWPCLLILLAFIGFISKSLYNYPIGIMAIIGLFYIIKMPGAIFQNPIFKSFTIVFLCFWIPLLISFFDAVNPGHSAHTLFPYLRFYFAGIFIIHELSKDNDRLKFIITSLFYIVFFWCIDATIQFALGKNLLGFPYEAGHITGVFYPRNTISHICSILSTFIFLYLYIKFNKQKWLLLSLIPLFLVILLSGRRAAWVMLALSTFGFLAYAYAYSKQKKLFLKFIAVLFSLITLVLGSTIVYHEPTHNRFKTTLGLFSGDYDKINRATAVRLPIWEASYKIFKSNPVNGIGPRGFRHVYHNYAAEDDYFVTIEKAVPSQPHIIILEILAETGIIGFIGYLFAIYLILQIAWRSNNKKKLLPYLIPVLVALFPFNTHMALYGSIWSSMVWLIISLYFSKNCLIINNEQSLQ